MNPISEKKILVQLKKVINSDYFSKSTMLCNFLRFIVEEFLKEDGMELKQYNIAVFAFKRSKDFDANDPIVRIQASRLRKNLSLYYLKEGIEDEVVISLPRGRYIPKFSLRKKIIPIEKPTAKKNTLAICLFKNLSNNAEYRYVADGFTEELLIEISRYKHIQLIRTATVEPNFNTSVARFSLVGSIRFTDEIVKISASVIDNTNQYHIWSIQQKHKISEIDWIKVQEELAIQIAQQIADITGVMFDTLLDSSNWDKSDDSQAYDAMLLFHKYSNNLNEVDIELLISRLENIIKSNSKIGIIWAVLANVYTDVYIFGEDKVYLDNALIYGNKAINLQPNSQLCHAYYAFVLSVNNEFELSNYHLNKALELNPNSPYFMSAIGWGFCLNGAWKKGLLLIEKGIEIDFKYPKWVHLAPFLYFIKEKDYLNAYEHAFKFDMPNLFWDPLIKLVACHKLNKMKEAQDYLSNLLSLKSNFMEVKESLIGHLVKSLPLKKDIINSIEVVSQFDTLLDSKNGNIKKSITF